MGESNAAILPASSPVAILTCCSSRFASILPFEFVRKRNCCKQAIVLVNASAESEARFREYVRAGTVLCAPSIQPFERGRWRLRRMRVKGPDSNGYGNSIFSLICKLLVLRYLENERV